MANPTVVVEVDFTGNPTATYLDTLSNTDGIVSYWRMASNTALTDVMGTNGGTVVATPTLVTGALPNDSNQAISFNGTTQRAYVPSSSSLTPTNFTVQGWVKFASLPAGTRDLVSKRGTWAVQISSTGIVSFTLKNDTSTSTVTSTTPLATGTYYHITAVHDSDNSMQYLYVDAVLDASATWAGGREGNNFPLFFAAAPSSASPTYQSSQTAGSAGSTSATATKPTSTASGDLMLAHLTTFSAVTVTEPTGWTLLGVTGTNQRTYCYYRVAGGSEGASYTWTLGSSERWVLGISRFTGNDTLAPIANFYMADTGAGTGPNTGSHLAGVDNNTNVALFSTKGAADNNWTADSGTERYDTTGGSGGPSIAMYTQTQATASALNVAGSSSASDWTVAMMVVLNGTGAASFTAVTEDEWTFWNVALSDDQIEQQYQARLAGVGAWVDITSDVRQISTKYGRQYELNRMEAGTATVVVKNRHRNYDPANTSGVYYPNVLPLRKIRIRVVYSAVSYPIFQGFIERWPSNWDVPNYDELTLTVVDGFEPLALAGVTGTLATGQSGAQINTVLDKALWPDSDRDIDTGLFTMAADASTTTAFALPVIQDIADSELGIFFIDHSQSGSPAAFHDRSHRWVISTSITSQATFTDAAGGSIRYQDLVPSFDKDQTVNNWEVTTAAGATSTATDPSSVSYYFRRTGTKSTRLDNPSDADTQAVALLQDTAKPALRFDSLKLIPTTSAGWLAALTLAVSSKVTVIRTPVPTAGGSTITKECFIEGVGWEIRPGPGGGIIAEVDWPLSPVSSASYYDTIVRDEPVSYWRMDTVS